MIYALTSRMSSVLCPSYMSLQSVVHMCLFLRKGTLYTMKRMRTISILALSMYSFFVIIVFHQSLISLMREMDHYKNGEEYEINTASSMNLAVSQKPKAKSIFFKIEKIKLSIEVLR